MTYDPYDDVRRRADQLRDEPRDLRRAEDGSVMWLPMLLVVALLIGAGIYYFGGRSSAPQPNMRADAPVTQPQPSPH